MKLLLLATLAAIAPAVLEARVICYFTNWSRYGNDPFKVEDIEPNLCTHFIYSFWGLDDYGNIVSSDPWNDIGDNWTEGALKKFSRLKNRNPSVKLLLGVGGWNEGPLRFQSMVRNAEKRKNFLHSSLNFIKTYNFDGLEIDWIYQDSYGGTPEDKAGLSELVREVKAEFQKNGYVLGIATSANPTVFDNSYDIITLSKYTDFINVMSYDFHGSWDHKTGHVAPLHPRSDEALQERHLNVESVIIRYINSGAIPEKLNVGLVTYGRTFTLVNPNMNGLGSPASGPGRVEPLPYRIFCTEAKYWQIFRNYEHAVPYAVLGNQWVGYEDKESLTEKVKFVKVRKLGGVSVFSIDYDDFKGRCGERYPLLSTVFQEMNKK